MKRKYVFFDRGRFSHLMFYKIGDAIIERMARFGSDDDGTLALSFHGVTVDENDVSQIFYVDGLAYDAQDYITLDQDVIQYTDEDGVRHHKANGILLMAMGQRVDDITSKHEYIIDIKCAQANWGIFIKIKDGERAIVTYVTEAKNKDKRVLSGDEVKEDAFYKFVIEIVDDVVDDMYEKKTFMIAT